MDNTLLMAIASSVMAGVVSSIATIAAVRVELRWQRRDIDDLRREVDALKALRKPQPLTMEN